MQKKLVRMKFRDKTTLTLPLEVAEQILDSKDHIIKIYDEQGVWTGLAINKADILGTDRAFDEESREHSKSELPARGEPVLPESARLELLRKYRPRSYKD